jgi:hypothetical protein
MEEKLLKRFGFTNQHSASVLQFFLQLQCRSLNHYIKVADRRSTGKIANSASDQKHSQVACTSDVSNGCEGRLLGQGQSCLEQVNVICHEIF